jgi:hypothetical protein
MDAASSPSVSDRPSVRADGSWMAWTAAGIAGIWVAVTVVSLGAPDMVTGSEQERLPVAALTLGATAAGAQGPPSGAGEGRKPHGVACQQAGVSTLQSLGLLPAVARGGIEVEDIGVLVFPTVLSLHRSDPELFQTGGVTVIVGGAEVPATWCDVV